MTTWLTIQSCSIPNWLDVFQSRCWIKHKANLWTCKACFMVLFRGFCPKLPAHLQGSDHSCVCWTLWDRFHICHQRVTQPSAEFDHSRGFNQKKIKEVFFYIRVINPISYYIWNVSVQYLDSSQTVAGQCIYNVWTVSKHCLDSDCRMSE